mgnify:FL=1
MSAATEPRASRRPSAEEGGADPGVKLKRDVDVDVDSPAVSSPARARTGTPRRASCAPERPLLARPKCAGEWSLVGATRAIGVVRGPIEESPPKILWASSDKPEGAGPYIVVDKPTCAPAFSAHGAHRVDRHVGRDGTGTLRYITPHARARVWTASSRSENENEHAPPSIVRVRHPPRFRRPRLTLAPNPEFLPQLENLLVEFMHTQDRRSAHQERCIGDMSTQLGKLAKAVESLCGALGPAMRDSITQTLGPQVGDLRDIAVETRRAASDLSAAAAMAMAQPPPSVWAKSLQPKLASPGSPARIGGPVLPAGAAARRDAALLATALAPEIEHIVAEAIARGMCFVPSGERDVSPRSFGRRRYRREEFAETRRDRRDRRYESGSERESPDSRASPPTTQRDGTRNRNDTDNEPGTRKRREEGDWEDDARRDWEEKEHATATAEAASLEKDLSLKKSQKTKSTPRALTEEDTKKIHSAIRWNKPLGTLAYLITDAERANCEDRRNGNRPIHIAAQNGFAGICKLLLAKGAAVDARNAKGNTGLHMALGYDYHECAELLVSLGGADPTVVNLDGHRAKNGLEG